MERVHSNNVPLKLENCSGPTIAIIVRRRRLKVDVTKTISTHTGSDSKKSAEKIFVNNERVAKFSLQSIVSHKKLRLLSINNFRMFHVSSLFFCNQSQCVVKCAACEKTSNKTQDIPYQRADGSFVIIEH
jgi:hypothetical protein